MAQPLVSILIPAYNRAAYLEEALNSALNQTYPNLEIVICDDSTNSEVRSMLVPYLRRHGDRIRYQKNERVLFLENWRECLKLATGEYVNFLMDDDLFLPDKIAKMLPYLHKRRHVSLVTSIREPMDANGRALPHLLPTLPLFAKTRMIAGRHLANFALTHARNCIGEPTTVLFRKRDLDEPFGVYRGTRYLCLNDMAAWLNLLKRGRAVYIAESLSRFRLHEGQGSAKPEVTALAGVEWSRLIAQSREDGFLADEDRFRAAIYQQQANLAANLRVPTLRSYAKAYLEAMDENERRLNELGR